MDRKESLAIIKEMAADDGLPERKRQAIAVVLEFIDSLENSMWRHGHEINGLRLRIEELGGNRR